MFHGLHHHNGIIDDNADGEHQAEQRQVVEAETHRRHDREGADDGDRDGDERNKRRTPVLQKDQHDYGHEEDGVEERLENFADRLVDERRRVVDDGVVDAGRETVLQLLHPILDALGDIQGVGAGQLINRQRDRWPAVERAALVVGLGAQLDVGHVAQIDQRTAVVLDHDVGELVGIFQTAKGGDDVLRHLAGWSRRLTDLAGGHLHVLRLHRANHVLRDQVIGRQPLRIEPEPHAVVALAEIGDVAHSRQTRQFVANLNGGVVAQFEAGAAVILREEVDDHQHVGRLLLDGDAAALDEIGQDRFGERFAVLHQHLRDVEVAARLEGHRQRVVAVVGALRGHVHHVLDAVDLLLNRGRDRIGDHLGIGPWIRRRHLDRGRRDLRVLRDRQREDGDEAAQHDDNGQHRREDRSIDEKRRKHSECLTSSEG